MRSFNRILSLVTFCLLGFCFLMPETAVAENAGDVHVAVQKKKKKDKKKKFKKTGTSADPFLKSTFELKKSMEGFNENYSDAKYYLVVLINSPGEIVGKDAAAIAEAASSLASDDLKGKFEASKDAIKEVVGSAKEVSDNLTGLLESLATASTSLVSIPGDAAKVSSEGAELPEKLKNEMTGLKAAKLPKALDAVSGAQSDLSSIQTEAPILAQNIAEIVEIIKLIME